MIFLVQRNGQLGNRLAYIKAFLAVAIEYRITIANFTFDEYARYFKGTYSNWAFCYPGTQRGWRFPRIVGRLIRVLLAVMEPLVKNDRRIFGLSAAEIADDGHFKFLDGQLAMSAQKRNLVFYQGWPIVPADVMSRHADQIREYFSLVDHYANAVRTHLEVARRGCDLLIGIHIRQGDYRHWNSGSFYYASEQYAVLMQHIVQKHAGKKVRFVVCSNVEQDWDIFEEFSMVRGTGETVEDMYILAGCDEIYGPQSSYSGWAAYYGQKPLYWITNPETFDVIVRMEDM